MHILTISFNLTNNKYKNTHSYLLIFSLMTNTKIKKIKNKKLELKLKSKNKIKNRIIS